MSSRAPRQTHTILPGDDQEVRRESCRPSSLQMVASSTRTPPISGGCGNRASTAASPRIVMRCPWRKCRRSTHDPLAPTTSFTARIASPGIHQRRRRVALSSAIITPQSSLEPPPGLHQTSLPSGAGDESVRLFLLTEHHIDTPNTTDPAKQLPPGSVHTRRSSPSMPPSCTS